VRWIIERFVSVAIRSIESREKKFLNALTVLSWLHDGCSERVGCRSSAKSCGWFQDIQLAKSLPSPIYLGGGRIPEARLTHKSPATGI